MNYPSFFLSQVKHLRKVPLASFYLHEYSFEIVPKRTIMIFKFNTRDVTLNNVRFNFIGVQLQRLVQTSKRVPSNVCWNCNANVKASTMFCETCKSLQPVNKNYDFFKILGINRSFRTENTDLRKKYRELQSLLHPDKFSSKPKKEQELSEEFSSTVNKAFFTLLNPLERGLYLLSLHNISIGEENSDMDKTFLMEIMERNEEIENETDPKKLREIYTSNKKQLDILIGKVAEAFDLDDLELAKKLITKMKYYSTIDSKIKEIKQKLNIPD